MANTLNLPRNGAVGFIDWLDDTATKPLFHEIMRLRDQPLFFWREILATQALNVFQCVEKIELLICVCNDRRVRS